MFGTEVRYPSEVTQQQYDWWIFSPLAMCIYSMYICLLICIELLHMIFGRSRKWTHQPVSEGGSMWRPSEAEYHSTGLCMWLHLGPQKSSLTTTGMSQVEQSVNSNNNVFLHLGWCCGSNTTHYIISCVTSAYLATTSMSLWSCFNIS